jgi:CHAT domain-containing protein
MNCYIKSIVFIGLILGVAGISPVIAQPIVTTPILGPSTSQTEADRLLQQGIEQFDRAEYTAAVGSWEQALKQYQATENRKMVGETIRHLGRAAYVQNDNAKALEYFQQSLTIARAVNDRQGEGRALGNLGLVHDSQKQRDQALDYYNQSLTITREVGDKLGEAVTSENLGRFYEYTDFSQAYTPFQNSLKRWRELGDRQREADVLLSIGNFYARWPGNCSRAIEEAYQPSLPIFRERRDRRSEALVLGGIGHCYAEAGKHPDGIKYLNQSLVITREVKNQWYEGVVLTRLGKSHQALDELTNARWYNGLLSSDFRQAPKSIVDSTKALDYAQAGLKIAKAVKNRWGEALAFETLGRTYAVLQNYEKAIDSQQQRLLIAQEFKDLTAVAETSTTLGQLYTARGDYATAITNHQVAIAIYQQRQQDYDARMKQLKISTQSDPPLFPLRYAFMYQGDTYARQADYAKAIQSYQAAFGPPMALRRGSGNIDITLLRRLGYTWAKWNKLPEAAATLRSAIDQEEIFRTGLGYGTSSSGWKATDADRIRMAEAQAEDYRQLLQVLVRQNRTDMALEVAEESRARTFVELLSERISGRPLGKDWPTPPNLDAIRQIAKAQNATLVEYAIAAPESLYIWVIKPTGEISFRSTPLEPKQGIPQLVARGRSEISVRGGRSGIQKIARVNIPADVPTTGMSGNLAKLHQVLIDPIAQDLPTDPNQRVIFMPQGALFLLPFAALRDAQGKYLIERHTISIAPSIQTLNLTRTQAAQSRSTGRSVIVGDPTMPQFDGEALPPLPGARQEAIAIGKILNTDPLLGPQATKSAVLEQLRTASLVHFATHGLLDTVKGDMPGAIALAPNGQDNGLLSASEIFDLKLRANLVVLSACDTGRGTINGDGVIGLSRSLIASGVPSVVVSLWAVDDNSTRVLMSDFYHQLQTNPNKAQAMRQAMLNTMKQYPNPKDWAAFTLIGESD